MTAIEQRLQQVHEQIRSAAQAHGRDPASVALLAVSKTRPVDDIRAALRAGQQRFGESYLQEALGKINELSGEPIEWHFIGRLQSNKTRPVAEHFDWVHSVDTAKLLRRLSDQRPAALAPLNVCLQVKIDGEASKGGLAPEQLPELTALAAELPRIRLRGLMTLPAPATGLEAQRRPFRRLRELQQRLNLQGAGLDTLSIGMSSDLEAAIAEQATLVRIGTAIFGPRDPAAPRR